VSAPRPPRLPGGAHRYGWFVAIVGVALIAYASLNTLRTHSVGSQGLKIGSKVPPFAAPLALGNIDGDVNVAREANQGSLGRRPACSVRGPQIVNSCALGEGGPFVLAFLATRGTQCTRELDRLARVRARHPGVQVAAVSIRGDRDDLRALVRRHGWRFPVAWDRDGILANRFGVAVCPQLTYALPGGVVQATSVGELDDAALDRRFVALEREARGMTGP
jgi:AhpC/TSA family protein